MLTFVALELNVSAIIARSINIFNITISTIFIVSDCEAGLFDSLQAIGALVQKMISQLHRAVILDFANFIFLLVAEVAFVLHGLEEVEQLWLNSFILPQRMLSDAQFLVHRTLSAQNKSAAALKAF